MVTALALTSALMVATHDVRAQDAPASRPAAKEYFNKNQPGFTIKLTLTDYMMVQRAMQQLKPLDQDDADRIRAALNNIRNQISAQVKP